MGLCSGVSRSGRGLLFNAVASMGEKTWTSAVLRFGCWCWCGMILAYSGSLRPIPKYAAEHFSLAAIVPLLTASVPSCLAILKNDSDTSITDDACVVFVRLCSYLGRWNDLVVISSSEDCSNISYLM